MLCTHCMGTKLDKYLRMDIGLENIILSTCSV